ncbi:MAG: hypothetical protein IR164_02985 [Devosia sp.]|uniref:hypothetical protein n=1 Tax=Devosia sp. TaxID=1871048 RepID=UPI0019E17314|nr:hypothetical protein [Devosia sp.]MBF0677891.1 hypothetical protein [Devosia sp.]
MRLIAIPIALSAFVAIPAYGQAFGMTANDRLSDFPDAKLIDTTAWVIDPRQPNSSFDTYAAIFDGKTGQLCSITGIISEVRGLEVFDIQRKLGQALTSLYDKPDQVHLGYGKFVDQWHIPGHHYLAEHGTNTADSDSYGHDLRIALHADRMYAFAVQIDHIQIFDLDSRLETKPLFAPPSYQVNVKYIIIPDDECAAQMPSTVESTGL